MNKQALVFITALFLLLGSAFSISFADQLDDRTREIAHKLRCPTCQALSVKESEAGLAVNMKMSIRQMLEEGKSEEEILKFFEERYGEWILRSPKKEGFNLVLWITPIALVVIASVILIFLIRKRNLKNADSNQNPGIDEKEKKRIDQEFEKASHR